MKLIIFFIFLFFFVSCKEKYSFKKPKIIKLYNTEKRKLRIGHLKKMLKHKKSFYYIDNKSHIVKKLDENFHLKKIIAHEGNGPGEVYYPSSIAVNRNKLYIYSSRKENIIIFDTTGTYVDEIKIGRMYPTRFAIDDSLNLYYTPASFDIPNPIVKMNYRQEKITTFGTWLKNKENLTNLLRNLRHVLIYKNNLICVSYTEPIIERYNLTGEKIFEVNINNYPFMKKIVEQNEKFYNSLKNKNRPHIGSFSILFDDAYTYGDLLYLTLYDEDRKLNKVLIFLLSNDKIIFKEIFKIDNCLIKSISADERFLYIFNGYNFNFLKLRLDF